MQARTEPKLHPETANMEFEKVTANRSATLKEPGTQMVFKAFLLKIPCWSCGRRCEKNIITKEKGQNLGVLRDSTWRPFIPFKKTIQRFQVFFRGKELKAKHLQEKVVLGSNLMVNLLEQVLPKVQPPTSAKFMAG